jgi:hypothetical protein
MNRIDDDIQSLFVLCDSVITCKFVTKSVVTVYTLSMVLIVT